MMSGTLLSRAAAPLLLAAAFITISGACSSGDSDVPASNSPIEANSPAPSGESVLADVVVTVYRSPTCGCCRGYEAYLEDHGFRVDDVVMDDVDGIKDDMQIPDEMRSCHTSLVGDYFVEGHVPVEAIVTLLSERPLIDGIALPGMPAGSPGMGGDKMGSFVIYSVTDGQVEEFMTV